MGCSELVLELIEILLLPWTPDESYALLGELSQGGGYGTEILDIPSI